MSKLKSLAKAFTYKIEFPENNVEAYKIGFEEGFTQAFKSIHEKLDEELKMLEQYPIMGERMIALKKYMNKMDSFLEDMNNNEY